MPLTVLAYFILQRLSFGEKHTINSLSKALAPYRFIIYETRNPNKIKTLKQCRIPKIDIGRCLTTLENEGLIQKQPKNTIIHFGTKHWLQRTNIYTITAKGQKIYLEITKNISKNDNTQHQEY